MPQPPIPSPPGVGVPTPLARMVGRRKSADHHHVNHWHQLLGFSGNIFWHLQPSHWTMFSLGVTSTPWRTQLSLSVDRSFRWKFPCGLVPNRYFQISQKHGEVVPGLWDSSHSYPVCGAQGKTLFYPACGVLFPFLSSVWSTNSSLITSSTHAVTPPHQQPHPLQRHQASSHLPFELEGT